MPQLASESFTSTCLSFTIGTPHFLQLKIVRAEGHRNGKRRRNQDKLTGFRNFPQSSYAMRISLRPDSRVWAIGYRCSILDKRMNKVSCESGTLYGRSIVLFHQSEEEKFTKSQTFR